MLNKTVNYLILKSRENLKIKENYKMLMYSHRFNDLIAHSLYKIMFVLLLIEIDNLLSKQMSDYFYTGLSLFLFDKS